MGRDPRTARHCSWRRTTIPNVIEYPRMPVLRERRRARRIRIMPLLRIGRLLRRHLPAVRSCLSSSLSASSMSKTPVSSTRPFRQYVLLCCDRELAFQQSRMGKGRCSAWLLTLMSSPVELDRAVNIPHCALSLVQPLPYANIPPALARHRSGSYTCQPARRGRATALPTLTRHARLFQLAHSRMAHEGCRRRDVRIAGERVASVHVAPEPFARAGAQVRSIRRLRPARRA